MERKAFTNLMEASARVLLGETHMIGKTVIVKGKKGKVIEQVGSDGDTESDEIYKVKFEDGTILDIPARDMEMQGDISNRKEPSENEAEDIVNEAKYRPTPVSPGSRNPTQAKKIKKTDAHSGIPGMSHKGKGILAHMTNSFETGGGPHIDHDNIHNLTHGSVNQTIKMANKHLEDNPHPEASKQLALIKKELGESTVNPFMATGILKHIFGKKGKKRKGPQESVEVNEMMDPDEFIGVGNKGHEYREYQQSPDNPKWKTATVRGGSPKATKTEKKTRTVQNRTAAAYARQKPELKPGPKTAKFNRLANQLDKLRRGNK